MIYKHRILILDDEAELRSVISKRLRRKGYEVFETGTIQGGLDLCKENLFDGVLLDLKLPDGNGLDLLEQIKVQQPDVQIIMLTGHGTIESAIEAMKLGAFDYLTKPCNLAELEISLQKACDQRKLLVENKGLREVLNRQAPGIEIIGESPLIQDLLAITRKVAQSDESVLIRGESGSGKELIARAVHLWSNRADHAFIPINCGAIPETLIESELFGHEKGAFTGAGSKKIGLVEMADQGTLFLDEIGEMPLSIQVKLLRFLETGEFRRVGDNRLRQVDVRIVAATNRDLQNEMNLERFRQDLFYRLNAISLDVPTLRQRKSDILLLADYFLKTSTVSPGDGFEAVYVLSEKSKEILLDYDFPGNIRELAHLIKRGQILASGSVIYPQDIWPEKYKGTLQERAPSEQEKVCESEFVQCLSQIQKQGYPMLEEVERLYILSTLKLVEGNRAQAAKLLGISVRNLYRKIESYGNDDIVQ
ncbi:sigma-54-dependent transcriptional regulator [Desulfosporosinus hippei]|uniref:Stage 0 sporulation protein A homolog n=1 Tax=Desulfosporosinus hippei DSM 8344 TaxID=1121419 RepID=A0A1G7WDH1_9FIRM|nr:sigma-54 dependent transcriptional regulator [Desulfosporosinus hippei]SDG70065.1 DNA-binding transcriptional response regulator, NtrC family, contains REC, AAA-type ATPase, and a Fis-type DNA-binding domains [Desulfosporosinus hippei DSM 8344]